MPSLTALIVIFLERIMVYLLFYFAFNGPLRQYFSLYRSISHREGERGEKRQRRVKIPQQSPPAPTASAIDPYPTIIQIVGRPGTESLPRTIAPPDHPQKGLWRWWKGLLTRETYTNLQFTDEKDANAEKEQKLVCNVLNDNLGKIST